MALALYRKYRPRTFAEVIGQEHVTEPLSQALRSGRLNHAYLFSGPRGCGKTSSARILARSLNCEKGPTPDPCGECMSCQSLANDGAGSIDVIEIDAASHGGVDDARDLREKAFFAPASSRYKIYVIDEAHMVSSAGFNALLKLVEEPPDYVKFIFATTEPDKVLGTIRSRTHHYPFRLIPPAVLRPYLQQLTDAEGVTVEPSVLPLVVRAGGGSARDSLSILDQLIAGSGPAGVTYAGAVALLGVTDSALIDEMCDAIATGQGAAAYATIDRVAEAGHEPRRFASDLLERFRDLIVLQQVPDAVGKGLIDGPADQLEAMARQAASLGAATLSRCADILHNGLIEMRGTTAPRLLLELVTARMLLPGADTSTAALLQRVERLEQGVAVRGEAPAFSDGPGPGPSMSAPGPSGAAVGGGAGAAGAVGAPGGAAGAAKAAAMAAARAASNRQSAAQARPVSPAPAPVSPAPAPVAPASAPPAAARSPERDGNHGAAGPSSAGAEDRYYEDEPPPWDEEPPAPDDSVRRVPDGERSADDAGFVGHGADPEAGSSSSDDGPASRPDEPLERVRSAWQALGQHQVKVKAMQDYGIGVRAVDGDMIVFAAPTQTLLERFLNWKDAIAAEFRKSPGGNWRIRGEVGVVDSGPARPGFRSGGPEDRRDQAAGHQPTAGASGRPAASAAAPERNSGRTESRPSRPQRPPAADADDDWPAGDSGRGGAVQEPRRAGMVGHTENPGASGHSGRPGTVGNSGRAEGSAGSSTEGSAGAAGETGRAGVAASGRAGVAVGGDRVESDDDDSGWPEPARPGGTRSGAGGSASGSDGSADDEWPEPVKPGGLAATVATAGDDWPEPVRPGGQNGPGLGDDGPTGAGASVADVIDAEDWPVTAPLGAEAGQRSGADVGPHDGVSGTGRHVGVGGAGPHGGVGGSGQPGGAGGVSGAGGVIGGVGGPGGGSAFGGAGVSAAPAASAPAVPSASGRSAAASAPPVAAASAAPAGGGRARSAAMEAARAAARLGAGAGTRTAERDVSNGGAAGATSGGAGGGASGRASGGAVVQARAAAAAGGAASSTWADGSPIGEAPYDPEYDGPPSGASLEGFDPGDEPLDEVIDEKTARASSEEQAMQLLREAFGAEKIAEM